MLELDYFEKMSLEEKIQFVTLYIGLDCFIRGWKIEPLSNSDLVEYLAAINYEGITFPEELYIRYKILVKEEVRILVFDGEKLIIVDDKERGNLITIKEYESLVPNYLISLLLDVSHNNVSNDNYYKEIDSLKEITFFKERESGFNLILGAGINSDYGKAGWENLEKEFKTAIDDTLSIDDVSKMIVDKVFNSNYGYFQILKDINYPLYKDILLDLVDLSNAYSNKESTTMDAIVNVIASQTKFITTQNVLTFNYDGLLERELDKEIKNRNKNNRVNVVFNKKGFNRIKENAINVIHPHGYLKEKGSTKEEFDSIVLTTDEYIYNYKKTTSYGYRHLYSQLDKTCLLIGNSITDYEEQKVLSAHFKNHPNQFHYVMLKKANKGKSYSKVDLYKTIFLFKIGVIPLWYEDYSDIVYELNRIANYNMSK